MKKLLLLLMVGILWIGAKAQCPINQAIDFTATDIHGTEVHLFDILDGGQAVLIDFFFTTCGPCQQVVPKVVESYYAMGCNMHDVFYMEIATGDSDAACLNWVNNYGVEYPTISGAGGGTSICNQYSIEAYPTVILIMPSHEIVIQDLYPIPSAQTVINALTQHGLQQHDCTASDDPQVTITVDQVLETEVTATFTPNDECDSFAYMMATESEIQQWMGVAGLELPEYLWTYGFPSDMEISHTFTELTPETEYVIYAVPADADGNLYEVVQEPVITTPGGGIDIMPDFTGTDIDGNEIHLYDILDSGQAVLINFFLTGDPYSMDPMPFITESYTLFGCNGNDVFFMGISSNGGNESCQAWAETYGVKYPIISRDGGGNTIAQSIPVALYPTVTIINPDHTIAYRDLYPLESTQTIIDALEGEGYEQSPCYEETLTLSADTIYFPTDMHFWEEGILLQVSNFTAEPEVTITSYDLIPVDGHHSDWYEIFYDGTASWENITIPQGETIDLYVYLLGIDKDRPYLTKIVFHNTLEDVSVIASCDIWQSVDENRSSLTLFPNPANESVTLKGKKLGTVSVYNTLGQKIEEFATEGVELTISTHRYENGVYFIKVNDSVLCFVVTH